MLLRNRPGNFYLVMGLTATTALMAARTASATLYHVSQSTGADTNDGSEAHPFVTISACATIAVAGDVCRIHAGTYRETVSPAHSGSATQPIRFEAADGECPIVSGTTPLTASFTKQDGNVWVASVADSIEQMFSSGRLIFEGQWPNRTPGVLFDAPKGIAAQGTGVKTLSDGSSVTYLVDPNLPAGDWTGARVYIIPGSRWQSDSRPVKSYDPSTHTLTLDTTEAWPETSIQPVPSNQYYLYNSKLTLDTQDEWFWQNGSLYYYSSDDPGNHQLEYKKRYYAFDVSQSYIEVVGLHVFGAAIRMTGNHNTVDSVVVEYSSHLRIFDAYYTTGDVNQIVGDDTTWKNSIIQQAGSAGLVIKGNRNLVQNNVITDVTYQATNHAGIDMSDTQHTYADNQFVFNTVARSGRSGIMVYGSANGRVLYNQVSDYALLTQDMGGIYAWGTDGQGTEIAYNDVGNSSAFFANGIYLDDATKHFVAHHNYLHDIKFFGACIKQENYYFNNTFANVGTPFLVDKNAQNGNWESTNLSKVENNLVDGTLLVRVGVLPASVTDYGYFESDVHVTADWQHVKIDFASLYQPGWFIQAPFDLTSVEQIAFVPFASGDFEFDLDNLQLEGNQPLMLDDFDAAGGSNQLGGSAWAGGSGDGTASTGINMTFPSGGATASSAYYAAVSGTMFEGWNAVENISWGNMNESLVGSDLSSYTGISFDIRGQLKTLRALAIDGNSPIQDHNASCAFSGQTVPACAIDQGVVLAGVTTNAVGAAPDLGASESGTTPVSAGAVRSSDPSSCGKVADTTTTLPPRATNPWSPAETTTDAGTGPGDAGSVPDSGVGGGPPGTGGNANNNTGGNPNMAAGGGCGCRVVGESSKSQPGFAAGACLALSVAFGLRRRGTRRQRAARLF